jgi:ketosteroid isomerase-like protein
MVRPGPEIEEIQNREVVMKKTMAWMLAGTLSLGCVLIAQASEMSGATEKAVAALEQKWAQAQRENNTEMEAPLLAEKFVAIDTDGKSSDRAQFIADEKATKYTTVDVEELQVTVFGDTAVARALITYKGIDPKGTAFNSHSRWTDTWVKMPDGKWQCVATHGSNVKM